ncbi:MAG: XRE family transcriptional regulator [Acidipropionibacterium sp.]|jgi:Zn-dependent peptidase ImmA (M78 family)/DNA-binding XRE family transcriptional regulator|nr:XRE family transcriptional regulator [Acidipropionibacterium sp.]
MQGVTQTDLAREVGVTQGFISHIENGIRPLPLDFARTVSDMYGLPIEFFSVPPSLTSEGMATFRKSSKATVREGDRVEAVFDEAARLFAAASEASGYHAADFADLRDYDEEVTAQNVRSALGISEGAPLLNATRAVERLGVGVVKDLVDLPDGSSDHSGVSRPNPYVDRPLIATVGGQPPAVVRMTVMHELAHVIYDREKHEPFRGTRSPEERRAFRFAGAMLIPADVVRSRVTESLTLEGYLPIKAEYGVSVAALIMRASTLKVISPQRKRSLFIQLSSAGWRKNEPVPVAEEHPVLLQQATERGIATTAREVAIKVGISYSQAARWTGLPMDRHVDGLADVIELRPLRQVRRQRQ